MKKNLLRVALTASLLCTAALAVTPALAQMGTSPSGGMGQASRIPSASSKEKQQEQPQAQSGQQSVSRAVAEPLIAAQQAAKSGDLQTALAKVKEAQAVPNQTPYETYEINKMLGTVAIGLKDNATAATAYEAAVESPAMPAEDAQGMLHNAVLLAGDVKAWDKVTAYGKRLEAINGMDNQTYAMTAIAFYNLKDDTDAKAYAQKSLDAAKKEGKQPEAAAQTILENIEAKNNPAAAEQMMQEEASHSNDPKLWWNVVELGLNTQGIHDQDALYMFRLLMFANAAQKADDYKFAAQVAETLGYPSEAKAVLDKGVSSGTLPASEAAGPLAKARSAAAADERELPKLAASAAKSKSGEQDVKMAEDYWAYGRYADVEASARSAIAKGGLKDPSEGQMMLGMALTAEGKYPEAIQTLDQVKGSAARVKAAHLWSLYAQSKQGGATASTAAPAQQPPSH